MRYYLQTVVALPTAIVSQSLVEILQTVVAMPTVYSIAVIGSDTTDSGCPAHCYSITVIG